jgi:hypothetical protein
MEPDLIYRFGAYLLHIYIYIHTYIYIIYVYVHTPFLHLSSEKVCVQVTPESPSLRSGLAEAGLLQRSRLGGVTAGSSGLAESRDRSDFHHIEAIKIWGFLVVSWI